MTSSCARRRSPPPSGTDWCDDGGPTREGAGRRHPRRGRRRGGGVATAGTPPRLAVVVARRTSPAPGTSAPSPGPRRDRHRLLGRRPRGDGDAGPDPRRAGRAQRRPAVHGIILQTPLPADAVFEDLAASIDPAKDVDGANPLSLGRLAAGLPAFAPATAEAVVALLDHHGIPLAGRTPSWSDVPTSWASRSPSAARAGRHRDRLPPDTKELAEVTRSADVLVAAVGRVDLITDEFVRPGGAAGAAGVHDHDRGVPGVPGRRGGARRAGRGGRRASGGAGGRLGARSATRTTRCWCRCGRGRSSRCRG